MFCLAVMVMLRIEDKRSVLYTVTQRYVGSVRIRIIRIPILILDFEACFASIN